ncbi:MAG: NCS1 family nucleobase:cation symporter-1 [Bacteroidia bacterium]|nr:NCS1 family nucleobase:cation symporter-1 [Bacteroidia bacterium]
MTEDIVELKEDVSDSPLYSEDLAPVPKDKRTWNVWNLSAIWVGMAVCIPTYILASYMIKSGLSWYASLIIIALANLIITIPMILNGHAGVKYGIPFPVLGRASFGTKGIHIASIVRGIVACGWFGIQTWIGGLAFYAIWSAATGNTASVDLSVGKFIGFGAFWLVNIYFIWKGTESIKWLEDFAAPILIIMGLSLIGWGWHEAGGFGSVLNQSKQLERPTAILSISNSDVNAGYKELRLNLDPAKSANGRYKATDFQMSLPSRDTSKGYVDLRWQRFNRLKSNILLSNNYNFDITKVILDDKPIKVQFRKRKAIDKDVWTDEDYHYSSILNVTLTDTTEPGFLDDIWKYLLWLTAMVGFWATMSISIADITRYVSSQKEQIRGQLIGLPGTMILYSFVGIFVTSAAVVIFNDVLIGEDAPWDPVSLLARFESPTVVIISQIFMVIATLSTNIAANVIAPANAFSNAIPKQLSFRGGGIVTAIIGILICPWWLLNEISGILIFISGLLGPVVAILICDYYVIRKTNMNIADLYKVDGKYSFGGSGINNSAMIALFTGILFAIVGYWVPALDFLYKLSWFSGFIVSFIIYYFLMKKHITAEAQRR